MSGYEADGSALAALCAECKGRCCRGHYIMLSKKDLQRLAGNGPFATISIDSPAGCRIEALDALSEGACPFLSPAGCVLPKEKRPLVCRLFPLTYALAGKEIIFRISPKCPHAAEAERLESWVSETRKTALEELRCDWTKKEIRAYGLLLGKSRKGSLGL